ncbi:MAG: MoaD family protein [Nitrososphaerales archaeon]
MVKVKIFGPLVQLAKGNKEVNVKSNKLREIIEELSAQFGEDFRERILNEKDELQNFIRVFINDKDVRFLGGLSAEVKDGDVVMLLPAIGGG